MNDFDADTPQLEVVKKWLEAFSTLDIKNSEPFLSRHYQYQAFPESPNLPKETKERYMEKWEGIMDALDKFEAGG
jgi:hypothetical protein